MVHLHQQILDVDVVSVNDPPTFKDFVSSSSIDENILNVLTVTVEDIEDDVIGYSLSGNDADNFLFQHWRNYFSNQIQILSLRMIQIQITVYEITIEASDGTDTVTDDLVITILMLRMRVIQLLRALSSQSVNENETISISFTVSDPQNDTITYSLSGVDKDLFVIKF